MIAEVMLSTDTIGVYFLFLLFLVFLQNTQRVRQVELRLLHVEVSKSDLHSHLLVVVIALDGLDSLSRILVTWT